MWIVLTAAKESGFATAEGFNTRSEAEGAFLGAFNEARADGDLLEFELERGGSGRMETRADLVHMVEVSRMGGLLAGGSSESEGVSGSAPLTGSQGASGSERPYGMREDCLLGVMEDLHEVNQVLGDRIIGEPLSAGDAGQAYNLVRRALQVLPGVYDTGNGTPSIEELRVRARRVSR